MFKFVLFGIILTLKYIASQEKLDINIFYESLCPDSLHFIKYQLYPAWKDIKNFVNLKLVPFGKSTSFSDGMQFNCQHGPKECEGNRVMSCALDNIPDSTAQVKFVNCYMNIFRNAARSKREFGQSCAHQLGLNWDYDIKLCYESRLGTILQLNAELETMTFKPTFIPTIVYNKNFNQELQDASLDNFKEVVCLLIKKRYPQACQ